MVRAVSAKVLDQLKELFDCWNAGDFDDMLAMYPEDGTFDVSAVFVDVAPARGHAEILRCWDDLYETLDGLRMDPVEAFSLGSGRYVADMRLWGKGRRSGVEVDRRYGYFCTFRREDGKCIRGQLLPDVPSALAIAQQAAVTAG